MSHDPDIHLAGREKSRAALSSVVAAVGLTALKLSVGIVTGSLGILAEAVHSGLDLVAAIITLLAVRISGQPADKGHPYGHGKVENLSALFETLLLLATCVWIVYEAVERLFFRPVHVDATIWAFIIMAVSIIVDISRSRLLYRVARKYHSQALEADALHFSTDIWSSAVVILGLVCVVIADRAPQLAFLHKADSVAALFVAGIVVYISVKLGIRSIRPLLDTAPEGLAEQVTAAVAAVPGVVDCHNVRVRYSGAHVFVDAHVSVDGRQTLAEAHRLTEEIEMEICRILPQADVTVHPEPAADPLP
ncbi:MAG: cation diffusion facilitator family transporter [Candidatus Eisenbacteria bacterium]